MTKIYEPAEDSFLLCDFLKKTIKDTNISFLDMGCGSCIVADTAKEIEVSHIVCADINPKAVETAQQSGVFEPWISGKRQSWSHRLRSRRLRSACLPRCLACLASCLPCCLLHEGC